MTMHLALMLLGKVAITYNDQPLHGFVSNKAQALLCYLVITGGTHTREELASLLWSEMGETEARANLRGVLHNLRQLVGPYLHIDRQTVAFTAQEPYDLDVAHLSAAILPSQALRDEHDLSLLQHAVDVYQGDLLQGLYVRQAPVFDEWLLAEREHVRQLVVELLYVLAAHHLTRGTYAEAIRYTTRLLDMDPWREEAHRQLMLVLALAGQRSAALKQYHVCCHILRSELHVEPSVETRALYQRLLHEAPDGARSQSLRALHPNHTPCAPAESSRLPFTGRETDYDWLFRQWEAAQHGHARFTLVHGEAGIGKTRLIEEVLSHVAGLGARVLRGHCHHFAHTMPYQPMVEVLRDVLRTTPAVFAALASHTLAELTRLLPELHEAYPSLEATHMTGDETDRLRLFEAITHVFLAVQDSHPNRVLFLDDLQFIDQASADLLRYLLRHLPDTALWCLGAYQADAVDGDHPLRSFVYDLDRMQHVARLQLHALSSEATAHLTAQVYALAPAAQQQLTTYLDEATEGNPFMLHAILQDLEQRGVLQTANTCWQLDGAQLEHTPAEVPSSVQAMVRDRVNRLPATAHALLEVAACLGRTFDACLLKHASNKYDQDIDESIEILLAASLLREIHVPVQTAHIDERVPADGQPMLLPDAHTLQYTFTHAMIQRVVYADLSYSYRQRMHERMNTSPRLQHMATLENPRTSRSRVDAARDNTDESDTRIPIIASKRRPNRAR